MKLRNLLLVPFSLTLLSCTHLLLDSSERLQLKNLSDQNIANFSVVGKSDTVVWIPDTVSPGTLSLVYEKDFVGSFHALLFVQDSSDGWIPVDLGKVSFDGGSELAKISKKDGKWDLDFE